jgi:hypothetical protein
MCGKEYGPLPKTIEARVLKFIFQYHPLFSAGKDRTPYRKLRQDYVRVETFGPHEFIRFERESLRLLAEQVMSDIDRLLIPTALDLFRLRLLRRMWPSGRSRRRNTRRGSHHRCPKRSG